MFDLDSGDIEQARKDNSNKTCLAMLYSGGENRVQLRYNLFESKGLDLKDLPNRLDRMRVPELR